MLIRVERIINWVHSTLCFILYMFINWVTFKSSNRSHLKSNIGFDYLIIYLRRKSETYVVLNIYLIISSHLLLILNVINQYQLLTSSWLIKDHWPTYFVSICYFHKLYIYITLNLIMKLTFHISYFQIWATFEWLNY